MTGPYLLLLCLLTAQRPTTAPAAAAQISTLEGTTLDARITAIQGGILRYRAGDRDGEIPLSDIERITPLAGAVETTSQAKGTICTFHFADGGLVEGPILPPRDEDKRIHVDIGMAQPLSFGLDALSAVRFGQIDHPAAEEEFETRLTQRAAARDLLIVPQESKAVVLSGALERLGPEQWAFRVGETLQTAALNKAYGVVLGGMPSRGEQRSAMLHLGGRNRIAAEILTADTVSLEVDAGPLGKMAIPWPSISAIVLRSGRIVYLSDLEPLTTTQRSVFDVSWPPRRDTNVTAGPIVIDGRRYPKGLGVHAFTALTYKIDGAFERFTSTIGLDDSAAAGGSAIFRIRGDDRLLFESQRIGGRDAQSVVVDLSGVRELTLECDGGPDLDLSDHGDWAEAKMLRTSSKVTR